MTKPRTTIYVKKVYMIIEVESNFYLDLVTNDSRDIDLRHISCPRIQQTTLIQRLNGIIHIVLVSHQTTYETYMRYNSGHGKSHQLLNFAEAQETIP